MKTKKLIKKKILIGKEEAAFVWIAMQHMLRSGGKMMTKEMTLPINAGEPTNGIFDFGSIDLGGASVQITYQPNNFNEGNYLIGKGFFSDQSEDISLFAQSYLGYGMYESRGTLETLLTKEQLSNHNNEYLINPCFLYNNTQHVSYEKSKFSMIGSGNYDQCWSSILKIFEFDCDASNNCHLRGVELPKYRTSNTRFIAIDNAYRAAKFFDKLGYSSIHELENSVREFCAMEYTSAVEKYTPLISEFRIKRYCYEGVYLTMLLQLGFVFYI